MAYFLEEVEYMNKLPHLFQPGLIGSVEIKNRVVMAPMGTTGALVGFNGTFSDRAIAYYERRAKGETGLIITGLNLVSSKMEPWEIDGVNFSISFDSALEDPEFSPAHGKSTRLRDKNICPADCRLGTCFPRSIG